MRPRFRLAVLAALATLALVAVPAAPTQAADPGLLRNIVTQIRNGTFDPCHYSVGQLNTALDSIPPDFDQYAPQVRTAIENGLNSRDCRTGKVGGTPKPTPAAGTTPGGGAPPSSTPAGGSAGTPAPPAPATPTRHPRITPTRHTPVAVTAPAPRATGPVAAVPTSATAGEGSGTPAVLILLAILAGLGALGAMLVGASRGMGWEPRWAPAARHAWGEAGHRAGGSWGDFRDWVRLGR